MLHELFITLYTNVTFDHKSFHIASFASYGEARSTSSRLYPLFINSFQDIYEDNKAYPSPLMQNGHNVVFIPECCFNSSQSLLPSPERWADSSTAAAEIRICSELGKMPDVTHSKVYELRCILQYQGHGSIPAKAISSRNQGNLTPYMQRSDEATGSDKFLPVWPYHWQG